MPDAGTFRFGYRTQIGYYDQEQQELNPNNTVLEELWEAYHEKNEVEIRSLLARFLFFADDMEKKISALSGGERARLTLCKLILAHANVLILDEPTNDLDIRTLTILEDYLDNYDGIVITVSHDRYFLDRVVNRIFAFEEDGKICQYEGGYTDYLEARGGAGFGMDGTKLSDVNDNGGKKVQSKTSADSGKTWKQNRPVKLKFTFKEQREFETIDSEIEALEEKIVALDDEIMKNATNSGKLNELTKQKEETETLLEEKMDRWVYLNDLAEKIDAQKNG